MTKYALVTGSTKGIGKAIGVDLLKKGYHVFFNYSKDDNSAKKLREELSKKFNYFNIIKGDLSDIEESQLFVNKILSYKVNLDCIVLNTGITDRSEFKKITLKRWAKVFTTNLTIPFFMLQSLSNNINKKSKIIFIGALMGLIPHSLSISYGVSKAALSMLIKHIAKHFAKDKITVNMIAPGFVETFWHSGVKSKQQMKKISERILLKRFAQAEEISNACMFIIDNDYINGQTIIMDGGYDYI
jgi:3-oxoacyl-[acyl-carrier protein] reductase